MDLTAVLNRLTSALTLKPEPALSVPKGSRL